MCSVTAPPLAARPSPGRPKDPAKRTAILRAASRLFPHYGFSSVSMEQIAQAAGVSKLTVYSHFGDKGGLLSAVVRAHCEQEMPLALFEPAPDTPLRERLLDIARAFFAMVMAPAAIAGHRMMCAPQGITPELALMFWEAGPARIQVELAAMLSHHDEAGELTIADARLAAAQFLALIKGDIHPRLMIGIECDESATARHLESAVDLFLRGYRP